MIGIFDSGSGGLTFLATMKRRYPQYGYIYFGDYDHCPYGDRSPEEIQAFTITGVQKLFDAGSTLVIIACNTASAWTLRKMQTEIFPDKRILGVTIPGAEKIVEMYSDGEIHCDFVETHCDASLPIQHVTVFATEQTVKSRTYAERVHILDPRIHVDEIALPGDLVRDIEALLPVQQCRSEEDFQKLFSLYTVDGWQCDTEEWRKLVFKYFEKYVKENSNKAPLSRGGA